MSSSFGIALFILAFMAAIGAPIAFCMVVSAVTYLLLSGQDLALSSEQFIQSVYDSFVLLAVPLFITAANIMNVGAISDRLLEFCKAIVGRFKGGMAQVDILVSLIFSGMSGSAVADAAGVGKVSINMMLKTGHYTPGYAGAVVAASATIGPIIPPSIPLVLYALVSDTSIGYLFLGGVIPGLLMTALLMAMNTFIAHRRNIPAEDAVPLREIPRRDADRASGTDDAGHPAGRHLWRGHHADRGGRRRGLLCASCRRPSLPLPHAAHALRRLRRLGALFGVGWTGHRVGPDLQLYRGHREHSPDPVAVHGRA